MATPNWSPLVRNYENEKNKLALALQSSNNFHPLLSRAALQQNLPVPPASSSSSSPSLSIAAGGAKKSISIDPLSDPLSNLSVSSNDPLSDDPLSSGMISSYDQLSNTRKSTKINIETVRQQAKEIHEDNLNTPWNVKKQQILTDYAVVGNITLESSSITEFSGSGVEDGSSRKQVDKYSQRLAQLESKKGSSNDGKVSMTQQEYLNHIKKLSNDLTKAWNNDERVGTLKIAIQLSKLLGDTSMPQFYPTIFVLVTNELDRFGDLVFNRLKGKAEQSLNEGSTVSKKKVLPHDFVSADVPSLAKETCRNWFYKIACIRELLPRVYIETALLKCYRFLTDTDYPQFLSRIGSIIRGLGDPLVSLYVRTYLVVVGNAVAPQVGNHASSMLQDVFMSFKMLKQPHHIAELTRWNINHKEYIRLMTPGFEWILKCIGRCATKEIFQGVLQLYRDHCNDSTVLKLIIDCFDGTNYSHGSQGMSALIKASESTYMSHILCFAALGRQLAIYPPPEEQKIPLLNDIWKVVSKVEDLSQYVECSAAWLDCIQRHYSEREVLILLSDLASKIDSHSGHDISESVQRRLETIISSLIGSTSAYGSAVLTSDHLLKIVDAFTGSKKVELCKQILETFKSHPCTNDAVLINTMFDIGRTIHDSIDCLSSDGETRYVAGLLSSFIEKIDFGRDLEQQLSMYVECRANFSNLDLVKDRLILCVSGLAMKAYKFMKGKHSKKTGAFAKACMAYCHITIPSIADVFRKLQLLLHCAQVALLNQCLPQTDTFLKAAVTLIPEMPVYEEVDCKRVHTEDKLLCYLRQLLSTLVVSPGHPDHGPFYIVQGLLNALPKYQWQPSTGLQTKVYIDMLGLLCTYAQRKFPYHVLLVESNDELYGGAPEYMKELGESISTCIQEILKQLTALGEKIEATSKLNQAKLILDLCNQLGSRMDLNTDVGDFIIRLLDLANKSKGTFTRADVRYMTVTIDYLQSKCSNSNMINELKKLTN